MTDQTKQLGRALFMAVAFVTCVAMPELALAQDAAEAQGRVSTFLNNLNSLLNLASIAVVTIAIIFAGYQIAFNHKRISDVAPVLLGGFLIGAAAQIAKMLVPDTVGSGVGTSLLNNMLPYVA
ncbi:MULTISPECIES: TrbC/VirB2 family protein [unclassified Luteimonas]